MVIKSSALMGMLGRNIRCLWRGRGGGGPDYFLGCQQCNRWAYQGNKLMLIGGRRTMATGTAPGKRLVEELEETEPHLIYSGPLTKQMRSLKVFSLMTSGMGLAMQPILLEKAGEVHLAAGAAVFGMVGFFTFVTPFFIHSLCKKYVTEISYDPRKDEYEAVTINLFLRKRLIPFKADDVKVPEVPGPFTTVTVKTPGVNKPVALFFAPEAFIKTSHYGRFMGYDKPIDFELKDQNGKNTK